MMTLRPTKDVMKSGIFYLSNSLRGVREALEKSFVEITIIYEIEIVTPLGFKPGTF